MNYSEFKQNKIVTIAVKETADFLYSSDNLNTLIDKLLTYRHNERLNELNLVYFNAKNKLSAIINFNQLTEILDLIDTVDTEKRKETLLKNLALDKKFPIAKALIMSPDSTIQQALDIFARKENSTNVITVLKSDAGKEYLGKISISILLTHIKSYADSSS